MDVDEISAVTSTSVHMKHQYGSMDGDSVGLLSVASSSSSVDWASDLSAATSHSSIGEAVVSESSQPDCLDEVSSKEFKKRARGMLVIATSN